MAGSERTESSRLKTNTTRAPWYVGAPLATLLFAMFAAGVAAAYHYGLLGYAAQDIMDSLHRVSRAALRVLSLSGSSARPEIA